MSLPYPYEVETGALWPRSPAPRTRFDVEEHVRDAIQVQGSELEIFGVPLEVAPPDSVTAVAEQLRRAVAEHFEERVSSPDAAIWESFASQMHAQLEGRTHVDASISRLLRLTIDAF